MKTAKEMQEISKKLRVLEHELTKESEALSYQAFITKAEAQVYAQVAQSDMSSVDIYIEHDEWIKPFIKHFSALGYKISHKYNSSHYKLRW